MHNISEMLARVAKDLDGYSNMRTPGNIGMATQGYFIKEGLSELATAIKYLADTIKSKEISINVPVDIEIQGDKARTKIGK